MGLRFNRLQSVVKTEVRREKNNRALREELIRVLGAPIVISESPEEVFRAANDRLDVLEATGRFPRSEKFKHSIFLEAARGGSVEARKLAARILPEKLCLQFLSDKSSEVRCAAAKTAPMRLLDEAMRKFPEDDQLLSVVKARRLMEDGIPAPKSVDEPFDMYGDERLDVAKQHFNDQLPKNWYKRYASKLCKDYGTNLEGQWEEVAAVVHANAHASFGFKIDKDQLLQAIYDHLEAREDEVLDEGFFRRTSRRLMVESLNENFMPVIPEETDPVVDLLESKKSAADYMSSFERLFKVKKRHVLLESLVQEGLDGNINAPTESVIPGGMLTPSVERAVDIYVDCWNAKSRLLGGFHKLSWLPNDDQVVFHLEMK